MESTPASVDPSLQKIVVTAADCRRYIQTHLVMGMCVTVPLALNASKAMAISSVVLTVTAYGFILYPWLKMLRRIRREGPIEMPVTPAPSIVQGRNGWAGIIVSTFVMSVLTGAALIWTALCALMLFITLQRPSTFPLFLILSAINVPIWWFTVFCWKRLRSEIRQSRLPQAVQETLSESTTISPPATQALSQPNPSTPKHWWTNTATREELQSVGRDR